MTIRGWAAAPPLDHLECLLDDTGIAQHAMYDVVTRDHGYCLDDNARGLILATALARAATPHPIVRTLRARTAAFVQHAWNQEARRFRNFMDFDRSWLEQAGSEDSHGRAIWALGIVARDGIDHDQRRWAIEFLERATPMLADFTSPRALAFGTLGLAAGADGPDGFSDDALCAALVDRLCAHLGDSREVGWNWFEGSLSYDNARLPHALLVAGARLDRPDWSRIGLDTLGWLCGVQTAEAGHFRPIGSDGFWIRGGPRARFDQQPIEAAASVAACLQAYRQSGQSRWLAEARRALAWFHGANDLGVPVAVLATGGCRDGLHPDRVNANQGAESTLAWLQADCDLRTELETARVRAVP